jgi:glutamine synthetase
MYGQYVFGEEAIKKYIMRDAYESLMRSIETGERIDEKTADFVAVGMKNWAMDLGATHYTHWFQPFTGKTAEKHDSFFRLDKKGNPIENFDGKILVKQEPDGSSFPNGGLRETHRARAYTVWDPSSFAFIQETAYGKVLCIPAIFISYEGTSMDLKTPLLKSINAINKASVDVCQLFDESINRVFPTLGWEQEYFVVDGNLFNARPDLMLCGRTLFGNASARGQQLDDHYFASIPERVHDFMIDFEDDCLMMGIPLTTRHNEVAPTQFECAPHFEAANTAADHNQLLMDILDRIAKRHGLRVLMHEKPYKGINGSGKHNNWSLQTDTGKNLFDAGDDPAHDLMFMTFFINTLKAVDDNAELLRASIANTGNEHRLGANEAPPAIISIFTGDDIAVALENFKNDIVKEKEGETLLEIDLEKVARIKKDKTDRNRTSPFPFTGNRFEFRAVGSSVNVSNPVTVLNTIMADQLTNFKKSIDARIAKGEEKEQAIKSELKKILNESERIIFNGDGYSQEWVEEAERRGLPHLRSTPEALEHYITEKSISLFDRQNIYSKEEVYSRYNIFVEEYINKIDIESRLVDEIATTQIIPACVKYQNKLIDNVKKLMSIGLDAEAENLKKLIQNISENIKNVLENLDKMKEEREHARELDHAGSAHAYHYKIKPYFDVIRQSADNLEMLVEDKYWPLPKYRELLFLH